MSAVTLQQAFERALQQHQAGRLAEAEAIYRQILSIEPKHAGTLHLLGVIASQAGRNDLAVELIRQAIVWSPGDSAFHYNLGYVLKEMGLHEQSIAAYRRSLELKPDHAGAHNNLGIALMEQGRPDEAAAAYHRALQCKPDYAEAHNNLGNVLKEQGRLDDAAAAYHRALQCKPDYAEAHNNLGNALKEQGQMDAAIAAYRRAVALRPNFMEGHYNLGVALSAQGQLDETVSAFRRVLELNPGDPMSHYNLGLALSEQGQPSAAAAAYRRALELNPNLPQAHNNLGNVLKDQGEVEAAIAAYRRALQLKPDYAKAHSNLLLGLHYPIHWDGEAIFREHCRWDEAHARPLARCIEPHTNDPNPARRLRIGYVSPDFRGHPVAYFLEPLLAHHNEEKVEVFCYDDVLRADPLTERLQRYVGNWRKIRGLTDAQAAELIRRDEIDILVDLAGHTADNRLLVFVRKPAPVQVTYLGYCDTTGMRVMDYRLTDAQADPPGSSEHFHTEQLVQLPEGAWCYRPPDEAPVVGAPPVLQTKHITFGCFNALPKIAEASLVLWNKVLIEVPGSRLLLKNRGFRDAAVLLRTRALLEKAGIAPERVELAEPVSTLAEHLASYARVDIALDTFPYHGTTTTCEALWMGVPVISLAGENAAGRVGLSLLSRVGLSELATHTPEEFVRAAAGLAQDLPRLAEMRSTLRQRMRDSPLMDAPRFTRNVEQAYRKMWQGWCVKGRFPVC